MSQDFVKNTKYDVLTPYGWEHFEGVVKTENGDKLMRTITTTDGKYLKCTLDHQFCVGDDLIKASDLSVGDIIEDAECRPLEIKSIEESTNETVYDVFNTESHHVITNGMHTHQCDELAFVKPKIAREFWSSVFPTLSCLSPDTYVLSRKGFRRISDYFTGKEVAGEYFEIIGEQVSSGDKVEKLSHGYVSPSSETIIITTHSGYKVEVTPNHPLHTKLKNDRNEQMVNASHQKLGNLIRYDVGTNVYGSHVMEPERAYELGSNIGNALVPDEVMMSCKNSQRSFLAGLYDRHGKLEESIDLELPYDTLYQIKLMLANMGIYSHLSKDILTISTPQFNIFGSSIKVRSERLNFILVDYDYVSSHTWGWDHIISIEESYQSVTYDFTVPDSHTFLQNGLLGSNTGGGCIITSTPSDDETLFAELWNNATRTIDEHGNEYPDGLGVNGFKALRVPWHEHPERGEEYKRIQIAQYGLEKFRREHELEFISMEETLIDPVFLSSLKGIEPIGKTSTIRWYKEVDKTKIYVVGYDPALGTGGDNAAIVIFEFPSMIQVGEWIHNKSPIETQVRVLKTILDMFKNQGFDEEQVFWSLENNSIGEAPLVMIREMEEVRDEEFFGEFMKEPKKPGKGRSVRKGFNTDHTSKIRACSRFKLWLETGKMTILSKPLVAELKGFVSQGRTYKARPGDKDDIVMATMLIVRMVEILMKDEDEYMDKLGVTGGNLFEDEDDDDDEGGWGEPMPIL